MQPLTNLQHSEKTFVRLSAILTKADDGPTKFMEDFEKSLSRILLADYEARANKAISLGMKKYKGKGTKAEAKAIKTTIDKAMKPFSKDSKDTINDTIGVYYKEVTRRFVNSFGLKIEKAAKVGNSVVFSKRDQAAIDTIERLTVDSAGKYFPDQISPQVSQVVDDVVFNQSLTAEQGAVKLQAELQGAMGVKEAATLPTRFASNPNAYFNTLSSNASVQSANVGRIISMDDAGVETYRVSAVLDKRTSHICLDLDGKEFSVGGASKVVDEFIGLESSDDLINLLPFNKTDTVPKWAGSGLGFPPYHHLCRTTVIPVVV